MTQLNCYVLQFQLCRHQFWMSPFYKAVCIPIWTVWCELSSKSNVREILRSIPLSSADTATTSSGGSIIATANHSLDSGKFLKLEPAVTVVTASFLVSRPCYLNSRAVLHPGWSNKHFCMENTYKEPPREVCGRMCGLPCGCMQSPTTETREALECNRGRLHLNETQ